MKINYQRKQKIINITANLKRCWPKHYIKEKKTKERKRSINQRVKKTNYLKERQKFKV